MEDEDVTLGIDGGDVIQLDDEDYEEFMDLIDESNMTDGEVVNHIFNVMFNADEVMKNMEMLNGMKKQGGKRKKKRKTKRKKKRKRKTRKRK